MSEANPSGASRPENQAREAVPPPSNAGRRKSLFLRPGFILASSLLLGLGVYFAVRAFAHSRSHVSTDDAFIEADIVSIAPKVAGQVLAVHVDHNQFVRAGDLLLEIDPRDYQAVLDQRKAALEGAKAGVLAAEQNLRQASARITGAQATLEQRQSEVQSDAATAERAARDLQRSRELIQQKTISQQEFDAARAAANSSQATLQAARHTVATAEADLAAAKDQVAAAEASIATAKAQVGQAEADLNAAQLNLSYTTIRAPVTGWITRRSVAPGDYVQVGQNLTAIVPTNLWVVANFKETQLRNMRSGQRVSIRVDAYGHLSYTGHVESFQAGSGARFSLLPPENAVGNFVKVVQRVPVKILFDQPLDFQRVYGPGMSVRPSVQVKSFNLPDWLALLLAAATAALAAWYWLHRAKAKTRAAEPHHPPPDH